MEFMEHIICGVSLMYQGHRRHVSWMTSSFIVVGPNLKGRENFGA